ncbi:MAG TPA: hypothetical protein VII27_04130 [Thermoplasmata archaeon]
MATTTVKVSTETNRLLDTLQAREQLRSRRRMTKDALIARLARHALEEDAEGLILFRAPDKPVPDKAWRRILKEVPFDWGIETREKDIDRILYGVSE